MRLKEDGAVWNGEAQATSREGGKKDRRKSGDRSPTEAEILAEEKRERAVEGRRIAREQKAIRSFISMCVVAHLQARLTDKHPTPPPDLAKKIRAQGGNVRWLSTSQARQKMFHELFCKRLGRRVPFEAVWRAARAR